MRLVSLREFRTRGAKALEKVPEGETVLLAGQKGPIYFLVPVIGDLAAEEREIRHVIAKASLREYARRAEAFPMTDEEIEQEIAAARAELQPEQATRKSA
jgi:antitoxin (DNA-binding transcriptional repressor) of toxin-antitoxin stability system